MSSFVFHAYRFLNANGVQCVVKNNGMWLCLMKLQSSLLSEHEIAPKQCSFEKVSNIFARSDPQLGQVAWSLSHTILTFHWVYCSEEHRLSCPCETSSRLLTIVCIHLHSRRGGCAQWTFPETVHCLEIQDQQQYILNALELFWGAGSVWKSLDSSNIEPFHWSPETGIQSLVSDCDAWSNFFFLNFSRPRQVRTVPSSSRGIDWSCRSNQVTLLDTKLQWWWFGRVLLGPISTWAIVFFFLGQFYSGQVQFGPILACPSDHPKCQDEKKRKKKEKRKRRRKRKADNQHSPCFYTANVRLSGFNGPSCGASPAGDAPHEGVCWSRKAEVQVFRV